MTATRSSILQRSKKAENKVCRYLFGKDSIRDWAEQNDIHGILYTTEGPEGETFCGEIKNMEWVAGAARLWSLMSAALEQAEGYNERAFAVYLPVYCSVEDALVMFRMNGMQVITNAATFKEKMCCEGEKISDENDDPDDDADLSAPACSDN
jgi:hypothetical protein